MSEKEKELATADNIAAVQSKDVVGIIAQGKNSTSGYTVFFEQSPIDVFPITLFYFLPVALFKLKDEVSYKKLKLPSIYEYSNYNNSIDDSIKVTTNFDLEKIEDIKVVYYASPEMRISVHDKTFLEHG